MTQEKIIVKKSQDEIYRMMPAEKKLKIGFEMFNLGRKLNYDARATSLQNRRDSKKP